jgi:hypothetical protein
MRHLWCADGGVSTRCRSDFFAGRGSDRLQRLVSRLLAGSRQSRDLGRADDDGCVRARDLHRGLRAGDHLCGLLSTGLYRRLRTRLQHLLDMCGASVSDLFHLLDLQCELCTGLQHLLDLHRQLCTGVQHLLDLCDAGDCERSCLAASV